MLISGPSMSSASPLPCADRSGSAGSGPVAAALDRIAPTAQAPQACALGLTLRALHPLLSDPQVTDLCINRPHEGFVETSAGWHREPLPFASFDWCLRLAKLVANFTRQRIAAEFPLLSAHLPGGERIQIAIPPATRAGIIAIAIRRPGAGRLVYREPHAAGPVPIGAACRVEQESTAADLTALLDAQQYTAFMGLAVRTRQNILVSGPTGLGKTTYTSALIREIANEERLITIEDASELTLDSHPQSRAFFYSKDDQGEARHA